MFVSSLVPGETTNGALLKYGSIMSASIDSLLLFTRISVEKVKPINAIHNNTKE